MMQKAARQAAFFPAPEKPGDYDQDWGPDNAAEFFLNVFFEGCPKKSKGSKPGLWLAFERSDR
jgi:hypothetical protein